MLCSLPFFSINLNGSLKVDNYPVFLGQAIVSWEREPLLPSLGQMTISTHPSMYSHHCLSLTTFYIPGGFHKKKQGFKLHIVMLSIMILRWFCFSASEIISSKLSWMILPDINSDILSICFQLWVDPSDTILGMLRMFLTEILWDV